jgi:hypothetical protein
LPAGPGGNVPYASSFQLDGSQSAHDRLLASIADTDSRSFFFWGHGQSDLLTWHRSKFSPPDAVTSPEIANMTGNTALANDIHRKYEHPYRFVFMDACGSYSLQMVHAFRIPFARRGNATLANTFLQWSLEPRAFVGWDESVIGSDITDDVSDWYRVTAQQIVLGYWQAGGSVLDAMEAWGRYLPNKKCASSGYTYMNYRDLNLLDPKSFPVKAPMWTWKVSGCLDVTRFSPIP